jgi:hypothetical protein
MVGASRDVYRARLEGRAELLEAARPRYRELLDVLRAPHWEERVRGRVELLRTAGPELERVDAALTQAVRRARVEGWPESSPTVRMLREVLALRDAFFRTAAERLGGTRAGQAPPMERFEAEGLQVGGVSPVRISSPSGWMGALEEHARCAPREVPPARRWAVALEVLPEDLPLLRDVSTFGALLRRTLSEPFDPARPLPFREEDVSALRRQWPEGEAALGACWARLMGVDSTGGVVGEVRKRAGREPHLAPHHGPELLAQAEFWFQTARARLDGLIRERLPLFQPTPAEWPEVVFWLCEHERNPEARLEASARVREGRAGLFGLAHELWEPLHADAWRWPERRWERMVEHARRAQPEARSAEAGRVRDALRTFILARSLGTQLLRGWREHDSLEAWVLHARELARQDGPE